MLGVAQNFRNRPVMLRETFCTPILLKPALEVVQNQREWATLSLSGPGPSAHSRATLSLSGTGATWPRYSSVSCRFALGSLVHVTQPPVSFKV